eukprot:1635669-Amphidinium_carterae.1
MLQQGTANSSKLLRDGSFLEEGESSAHDDNAAKDMGLASQPQKSEPTTVTMVVKSMVTAEGANVNSKHRSEN